MTERVAHIIEEARNLSLDEVGDLIDDLVAMTDVRWRSDVDDAWLCVVRERDAQYRSGTAGALGLEESMKEIREQYRRGR